MMHLREPVNHAKRDFSLSHDDGIGAVLLQHVDLDVGMRPCDDQQRRVDRPSLLGEFWDFLRHNKKWWLLPLLVMLLLIGVLIILAGTGAAPFIYTLF